MTRDQIKESWQWPKRVIGVRGLPKHVKILLVCVGSKGRGCLPLVLRPSSGPLWHAKTFLKSHRLCLSLQLTWLKRGGRKQQTWEEGSLDDNGYTQFHGPNVSDMYWCWGKKQRQFSTLISFCLGIYPLVRIVWMKAMFSLPLKLQHVPLSASGTVVCCNGQLFVALFSKYLSALGSVVVDKSRAGGFENTLTANL